MRGVVFSLVLFALLAPPIPSRAEHDGILTQACEAPSEFVTLDRPLDRLAAAIAAGGPVNVLAVGSATTVGDEAGNAHETSFPYRMIETLQAALPAVSFNLVVRGGRGLTAEAMLPLLRAEMKQRRYQLVIWQTGTVEAVRGVRPDSLRMVLETGAEAVRGVDGDLVLVDPQFSRFLRANADLDPYESVLRQLATMPGVVLFHRFDLMRRWATDGRMDLERAKKTEREQTVALLNRCLGQGLARFVLTGARIKPH